MFQNYYNKKNDFFNKIYYLRLYYIIYVRKENMIFIVILLNIFYFTLTLSESIDDYRNRLLSFSRKLKEEYYESKDVNYLMLDTIPTKYSGCVEYYDKYVTNINNENNNKTKNISFKEYLEYWWNLNETKEELLDRICKYIMIKYPKKNIRMRV